MANTSSAKGIIVSLEIFSQQTYEQRQSTSTTNPSH